MVYHNVQLINALRLAEYKIENDGRLIERVGNMMKLRDEREREY